MKNVHLAIENSNRANIFYMSKKAPDSLADTFSWPTEELLTQKQDTKKYIIYCRSIMSCAAMYKYFSDTLGEDAYIGIPGVNTRLFAMFHHSTRKRNKKYICETFQKVQSSVRIVIATIAFGMGIDVSDVFMVIHWGASRTFDGFYQESGRAGRDPSMKAYSLVYYHPSDISTLATDSKMRMYCLNENNECRRSLINTHFTPEFAHAIVDSCCDLCNEKCIPSDPLPWKNLVHVSDKDMCMLSLTDTATRNVNEEQQKQIKTALQRYLHSLVDTHSIVNPSIRTGLDMSVITDIVNNISVIHQVEDLLTGYLYDAAVARSVMGIIDGILE